jgi:hypothetical protein
MRFIRLLLLNSWPLCALFAQTCTIGVNQPPQRYWTHPNDHSQWLLKWPKGILIQYMMAAVNSTYRSNSVAAINSFASAASSNGSQVQFEQLDGQLPPAIPPTGPMQAWNRFWTNSASWFDQIGPETYGYSDVAVHNWGTVIVPIWAVGHVDVHLRDDVTNIDFIKFLAGHEIGHSFGLADCVSCSDPNKKTTLMRLDIDFNSSAGPAGVTTCDNKTIQMNYQ